MNRRGLLKAISVGAVMLTVPALIAAKVTNKSAEIPNDSTKVTIVIDELDFGGGLIISYKAIGTDHDTYRHEFHMLGFNNIKEMTDKKQAAKKIAKHAADGLSGWMRGHKKLNHIIPPTSDDVFDVIKTRFSFT